MLEPKILHVMLDEKFLDMAYRDFETVSPNTSIYTIPKEGNPLKYIKTFIPFECTINDYQKLFRENNIKAVVFHSLNPKFYPIFDILPNGIKTLWIGWGYDYYKVDKIMSGPSTMMMCTEPKTTQFVMLGESIKVKYDSRLPQIYYLPENTELRYRVWRAESPFNFSK